MLYLNGLDVEVLVFYVRGEVKWSRVGGINLVIMIGLGECSYVFYL